MQKKKRNSNFIFVIFSLLIIIVVYLLVSIIRLFIDPTETTLVKNGELIKYEEVDGYIIRNEEVIDTKSYEGMMQNDVKDSTRIPKDGIVATYVSKSQEALIKKIDDLNLKIEEAMQNQKTIYSPDVKAIEASIQIQLYENIKNGIDLTSVQENKIKLNSDIKKKAQIVGELSPVGSKLKELISERTNYEKQINDAKRELRAPRAGLISYRVDGLEEVLTPKSISNLTYEDLKALKINTNQTIARDTSKIKIIDNFECLITTFMNSPESKSANLNDKLYLRFESTGETLVPATIEYISEEDDGRLITVKVETNVEELAKYRKISFDVVWWSYKGFKLHKSLVKPCDVVNQNGAKVATLDSVTIKKASYEEVAYVKIVKEFGDYVIVENYTDNEYIEMGFTKEDISNFQTLKLYNEVVVQKEK